LSFFLVEGVLYAEKDFNLAQHPEIKEVPNLQVTTTFCSEITQK
jgi:hypothetical protein